MSERNRKVKKTHGTYWWSYIHMFRRSEGVIFYWNSEKKIDFKRINLNVYGD